MDSGMLEQEQLSIHPRNLGGHLTYKPFRQHHRVTKVKCQIF